MGHRTTKSLDLLPEMIDKMAEAVVCCLETE